MYLYRVKQEDLEGSIQLDETVQDPLLITLAAFFYHLPNKASFDKPISVYQDDVRIDDDQVVNTTKKLKIFFSEMKIIKNGKN